MKLIVSALFAAAALSTAMVGSASAAHYEIVCTTTGSTPNPPSGTYENTSTGKKWAGFKSDGTPPDSLVSSAGTSTTCVETAPN